MPNLIAREEVIIVNAKEKNDSRRISENAEEENQKKESVWLCGSIQNKRSLNWIALLQKKTWRR
jgi:hypothetical protein